MLKNVSIQAKKVAFLTSVHPAFDVRVFQKEAVSLARAGYDVTLIAPHEIVEIVEGVKILGLQKPQNRIARMTKTAVELYKKALNIDADIYHFHDPELMPIGLKLRKKGKRVIFDIHEDTRQQIILKSYIPSGLRKLLSRAYASYEDYACRKFSALITPQEKMTEYYRQFNRTETVENFVDLTLYPKRTIDFTKPVLLHAGGLSVDRGLYNMVNAAKCLKGDFVFNVAGFLSNSLDRTSLHPLTYLGYLNQKDLVNVYSKSNIGIILYNNVGQYWMAGAVKCYEYMANAMPIIMPDFGEWVQFNEVCRCGINVDVQNGQNVADAVHYLVANPEKAKAMGENGRRWVEEKYSWQAAFRKLDYLYQQVLTAPVGH